MVPARTWARIASGCYPVAYTSVIPVYRLDVSLEYTLDEKKASRSQQEASLREAVDEALNQDQTERDLFLSAVGCTVESAFDDMRLIKKMWHKEKGVQGFHLVQSFAPGEASPELAHQIGQEFAQKLLNGKFQVIISTHLNTKCLHNHLVWNSVSLTNGKKYRSNQKTYITRIRRISDELCQKYHLSIIDTEKSQQAAMPYAQWLAEKKGQPTWKTVIQQDVDAAAISALTWKQFLWILGQQGYTFQLNRKYFTLRPPGKERPVRFKTLGPDYTRKRSSAAFWKPSLPYRLGKGQPGPALYPPGREAPFPRDHRPAGFVLFLSVSDGGAEEEAPAPKLCAEGGYPKAGPADRADGIHFQESDPGPGTACLDPAGKGNGNRSPGQRTPEVLPVQAGGSSDIGFYRPASGTPAYGKAVPGNRCPFH